MRIAAQASGTSNPTRTLPENLETTPINPGPAEPPREASAMSTPPIVFPRYKNETHRCHRRGDPQSDCSACCADLAHIVFVLLPAEGDERQAQHENSAKDCSARQQARQPVVFQRQGDQWGTDHCSRAPREIELAQ